MGTTRFVTLGGYLFPREHKIVHVNLLACASEPAPSSSLHDFVVRRARPSEEPYVAGNAESIAD